jgi:hypothetical protein
MAAHEFFFALEVSSQGAPAALVEDLAHNVFRFVNSNPDRAEGLRDALERAVAGAGASGARRCDIQFRAGKGELEVLVSSNGGRVWQTTIVLA